MGEMQRYMKVSAQILSLIKVHISPILGNQAFRELTKTFMNHLGKGCLFFHFLPLITLLWMPLFLIFTVGLGIDQAREKARP